MAEFALELHPDKTRLIEFGRRAATRERRAGRASRGRSTSWGSRTSARDRGGAASCYPSQRDATARWQSCWKSLKTSGGAGTRTSQSRDVGWGGGAGLLRLPRGAHQRACPLGVPPPCHRALATRPAPAQPEGQDGMGPTGQAGQSLAAQAPDIPPLARSTLPRQAPKVGAGCGNAARTVLCGGRAVMRVPTAMPQLDAI